jgi:flagellar hook-basal body complex protein FliE
MGSAGAPARAFGEAGASRQTGFAAALKQSVSSLTQIQAAADVAMQSVATGDLSQLHAAMVAIQKASLALELAIAVRNHAVDGVQELLRTQS